MASRKFQPGDRVVRTQMTREYGVAIGCIGVVRKYIDFTTTGIVGVLCNWNQPENPEYPSNYWIPECDMEFETIPGPASPPPTEDLDVLYKENGSAPKV